jgi:predicted enzyme related to lactoylglutathione lyase
MTCQLFALGLDADDPSRLARFWAGVLGQEMAEDPRDGITLLPGDDGDDTAFRLRFLPTRQPRVGQDQRHLHLTSTSLEDQQQTVARALGLGATHIDIGQRPEEGHVVLADPEGNEFCVIRPGNRWLAGCGFFAEITCDGSPEVGYFWSEALGWPLVLDEGQQTAIRSPRGGPKISWDGERLLPEARASRLRFDLAPSVRGDQQAELDRLVSLGATRIDVGHAEVGWVAMADPDGREFRVQENR